MSYTRSFPPNQLQNLVFCRALACVLVVLLHVAALGFHQWDKNWWASNTYDGLARISVPLFLMLSGALLLHKREPLGVFFKKRFRRILPPLIGWSFFYLIWNQLRNPDPPFLPRVIVQSFYTPTGHHLWYLYALIGIYLTIPFLRVFYQHSTGKEKQLWLLLWTSINGGLIFFPTASVIQSQYALFSFIGLIGYVFVGAWIMEWQPRRTYSIGAVLSLISGSLVTLLGTYWLSRSQAKPSVLFYDYLSLNVILAATSAFYLIVHYAHRWPKPTGLTLWLSTHSLTIYGIHVFFIQLYTPLYQKFSFIIQGWWLIPIFTFFILIQIGIVILIRRLLVSIHTLFTGFSPRHEPTSTTSSPKQ